MSDSDDHDEAIPVVVRLEDLITGEDSDIFWLPKHNTDAQLEAKLQLSAAVVKFERQYGTDNTVRQLQLLSSTAKLIRRCIDMQEDELERRLAELEPRDGP